MHINNAVKRHQVGATLLEIMMVLGVVALIVIGALAFFQKTSTANKVQTEIKNLGSMIAGIEQMYSSQGNYNGLTNTVIWSSNFVPDSMKGPATPQLFTQWKGAVTVTATGATFNQMQILLRGIPTTPCMDLVSGVYKQFATTIVGATTITPTSPTAVSDIATACGASATPNITLRR